MTKQRWQRVETLYHAAVERQGAERAAFMERACNGDEELRKEVDTLLAAHAAAGSFLSDSDIDVANRQLAESSSASRVGDRLGPYELLAPLGHGGMGEVYRARDVRLDRIVAIKILAQHVADDPEFHRRLEREARTISQLSHPHICALYDIGQQAPSAGTSSALDYLVLEYLEGETLADRLARGALTFSTALQVAIQIASALDAAHRAGIVHRDLKPGNVFLVRSTASDVTAKLLDFGLAKPPAVSSDESSASLTATGTILGTVPYMAPEQLEGRGSDARSDIFSFGAVLYEMLTGRKPFEGHSRANVIAAILEHDPTPLAALQPEVPALLAHIVQTCLAKDPDDRCQTMRDLLRQLTWVRDGETALRPRASLGVPRKLRRALLWAAAIAIVSLGSVAIYSSRQSAPPTAPGISFSIHPPEGGTFAFGGAGMAISPDGSRLAFVSFNQLWVRRFDSVRPRALDGTDGATFPFWSPDGTSIGFFAQGKVKRIAEAGGEAQTLCEIPAFAGIAGGGAWNRDGTIIFSGLDGRSPIRRVPDTGGVPTPVTTIDAARNEFSHGWPVFLPDGRRFLYVARSTDREQTGIYQASLDSTPPKRVLTAESKPALLGNHLLVLSNRSLIARAYDPDRATVSGEPIVVVEQLESDSPLRSGGAYAAAANALAYRSASPNRRLGWFDRAGQRLGTVGTPADYTHPALSLDDSRLAIEKTDALTGRHTIWTIDLARDVTSRLVSDATGAHDPWWSPDGSRVVFGSDRLGLLDLFSIRADGEGGDQLVLRSGDKSALAVTDWSSDGRFLLYEIRRGGQIDLGVLPMSPTTKGQPFLATAASESQGQFSPDTRWVAYASDESGSHEVYVRRFPEADGKWQVSTRGGTRPRWRRDGKELFYLTPEGKLMAVDVTASRAAFATGTPRELFHAGITQNQYVVTADGQRFLVNIRAEDTSSEPITVVLNWQSIFGK